MEERPWAEWKASKGASAKPLTPTQLARLLKPFGIAPRGTIRIGAKTAKGYHRDQFAEAWRRYGGNDRHTVTNPMKWALLALFEPSHPNQM